MQHDERCSAPWDRACVSTNCQRCQPAVHLPLVDRIRAPAESLCAFSSRKGTVREVSGIGHGPRRDEHGSNSDRAGRGCAEI